MNPQRRAFLIDELDQYFGTCDAASGYRSNWGDMIEKMAGFQFACEFDDASAVDRLDTVRQLRRVRSAIKRCDVQNQHILAAYFCELRSMGLSGKLDRYLTYYDHELSRKAEEWKAARQYVGLVRIAEAIKQSPETLLAEALADYDARRRGGR